MTTPGPGPTPPYPGGPPSPYAGGPAAPYAGGPAAPYVPAPGWATPSGYVPPWGPPPPPPTEPLAVASLVTSCAALVAGFLTGPVGVVLGIVALRRIRRTGAQGRGFAVAGIAVGGVMTAALVLLVGLVLAPLLLAPGVWSAADGTGTGSATSDDLGADPGAGADAGAGPGADDWADATTMPWFELTDALVPGDCLALAPQTYDMSDASVVDCAVGHESEVVDRLAMSSPVLADLTRPDAEYTDLQERCEAAVGWLLDPAVLPEESYADVYYPHPDQWEAGAHSAYCVLTTFPASTGSALAGSFAAGAGTSV